MVNDAEKYKAEDDMQREKIAARNQLEAYLFSVKQAAEEAPSEKLSEDDKRAVAEKCRELLSWLDNNQLAEKEEFEYKLKEVQKEMQPFMMKMHGAGNNNNNNASAGPQMGGGRPGGGFSAGGCGANAYPGGQFGGSQFSQGPTIEEVD